MQHNRVLVYLEDILVSANAILGITMFEKFASNRLVYSAVEREITIIAEALNKIEDEGEKIELKHTRQIIGLRNRIVHDYANINQEIIWGVVVNHIKPLIVEIEELIKKYE